MYYHNEYAPNSSPTKFVISVNGEFTLDNFLKGLRMDKKCGLFALVETFFDIIDSNKNGVNFFISEGEDLNYIIQLYCDHDKEKMKTVKKFLADKREVYFGTFEDQDCSIEELYLCRCKYFISNKDLYFDFEATNSRSRVCVSDKPWLAKAP